MLETSLKSSLITQQQAGFTIVEVLVTVILLVFGLSTLLSAQSTSIRMSQDGHLNGMATNAGTSLVDRIRANAGQASNYVGMIDHTLAQTNLNTVCAIPNNCTDAEQVLYDQVALMQFLSAHFPNPVVTIEQKFPDPAIPTSYFYTLNITWNTLSADTHRSLVSYNTTFWI